MGSIHRGAVVLLVGTLCILLVGMRGPDPHRTDLEEKSGTKVYSSLEEMNQMLEAENHRLHSLLQEDETANMHIEAGLQVRFAHGQHILLSAD